MKKTDKILSIEKKHNEQIETLFPKLIMEVGLTNASDYLGMDKNTLRYWMTKMNFRVERIVLHFDEEVKIVKKVIV